MLTAVIAAIEAGAVALAGVVAVGLPALLLWLVEFGPEADPVAVLGGTVSVWLLAHLVPLEFSLGAETALGMGLPPETLEVPISLAPLGLTLITVLLAARAGLRFARDGGTGVAGVVGGMAGFGAVSAALAGIAFGAERVPFWVLVVVPSALYGASALLAFLVRAASTPHPWWLRSLRAVRAGMDLAGIPGAEALPGRALETLRLGLAGFAGLAVLGAFGIAVSLTAGYVDVTALAQGLQLDAGGAVVMFLLQLAYLPVLLIWAVAWFSGAGFAIGEGTSISPFETLTGPLPAVPILGALPQGWGPAALLAPMLIVVLGLGVGVLSARLSGLRGSPWAAVVAVPVVAAALLGLVVAGAVALASGAIGPDRLAVAGADAWLVGGLVAGEFGGGLLVGAIAGRVDAARIRSAVPGVAARVRDAGRARVSSGLAASSAGIETLARRVRNSRADARLREEESEAAEQDRDRETFERTMSFLHDDAVETSGRADPGGAAGEGTAAGPDAAAEADGGASGRGADDDSSVGTGATGGGEAPEDAETPDDAALEDLPPLDAASEPELTPEEEEALLRAFSWDGEPPRTPENPAEPENRESGEGPGRPE